MDLLVSTVDIHQDSPPAQDSHLGSRLEFHPEPHLDSLSTTTTTDIVATMDLKDLEDSEDLALLAPLVVCLLASLRAPAPPVDSPVAKAQDPSLSFRSQRPLLLPVLVNLRRRANSAVFTLAKFAL
jgi:hypothetical protein